MLVADIPGLIEGASEGKGLGDDFLRHIERTTVLVHVIDIYQEDIADAYRVITQELKHFSATLASKPQVIALNKAEGLDAELIAAQMTALKKIVPKKTDCYAISAKTGMGIKELLNRAFILIQKEREKLLKKQAEELPVIRFVEPEDRWRITYQPDRVIITGGKIERFARRTDFTNPAGVQRLRDILSKIGIIKDIERNKTEPGTIIQIGEPKVGQLEY